MTLNEWLKGKNTSEFARQMGVDYSTIYRWRRGDIIPNRDVILRIKDITNDAVRPEDWYV